MRQRERGNPVAIVCLPRLRAAFTRASLHRCQNFLAFVRRSSPPRCRRPFIRRIIPLDGVGEQEKVTRAWMHRIIRGIESPYWNAGIPAIISDWEYLLSGKRHHAMPCCFGSLVRAPASQLFISLIATFLRYKSPLVAKSLLSIGVFIFAMLRTGWKWGLKNGNECVCHGRWTFV